ncbi:hypothetical protein P3G55_23530 [Leptospira sp. 96542]|nr:hypothetical protein [Leptospira sp. 96542]
MRKLFATMAFLSFFGLARSADFSEGQIWSYKTRIGEENSKILINKIEFDPRLGPIFHISITGVKVKSPRSPSGIATELSHAPVSKKTLDDSVTKLVSTSKPDLRYREGYKEWKSAFDNGDAGVFTISIQEIVGFIETTINQ